MPFTTFRSHELQSGLVLEERKGAVSYVARGWHQKRPFYLNTKLTEFEAAKALATQKFDEFVGKVAPLSTQTMDKAADLNEADYLQSKDKARRDFRKRWNAIKDVHRLGSTPVQEVTTKFLLAFAKARDTAMVERRGEGIKPSTIRKDWVTIGPVLRRAKREGWIARVPELPELPKIEVDSNIPFKEFEWVKLRQTAEAAVAAAPPPEAKGRAQAVLDQMIVITYGLIRPEESERLHVSHLYDDGKQVWMRFPRKTGTPPADIPSRIPKLTDTLRRLKTQAATRADGLLFPPTSRPGTKKPTRNFSKAVAKLIEAADLQYWIGQKKPRTSWSLRPTGICLEVLRQRRADGSENLHKIARWAGNKVERLEKHYLRYLDADDEQFVIPDSMSHVYNIGVVGNPFKKK